MTNPNPIFQLVFTAEAEVTRADNTQEETDEEQ